MAKFCGRSHPARANDEENLGKDEIAQTEFFPQRRALVFNLLLGAIQFCSHQLPWRRSWFLRWRLGPKFFVPNLAAGVGNVAAHPENNYS